jgi:hypothetical protein
MKPFAAALAILAWSWSPPVSAQTSPQDLLFIGEAVDRALGPNAELAPPVPAAEVLPPPSPPPLWYWRQPFDQQPFFATQPPGGTPGCVPRVGGPRC